MVPSPCKTKNGYKSLCPNPSHPPRNGSRIPTSRATWGWGLGLGRGNRHHALRIVFGGIFDRFPKAKLLLGHLGETLPFLLWRIDNRAKLRRLR